VSPLPPQSGKTPGDEPGLEHYLDRRLRGAEKEAMEQRLRADPDARAQARIQKELNASLARLFPLPAEDPAPIPLPARPPAPANPWRRRFPAIAAAAVVLLAVGLYFAVFRGPGKPAVPDRLGPLYRAQIAAGFVPEVVCNTREEFADWVQQYFGQRLYPDTSGKDLQLVGWNYGPAISSHSGVLLARVDGREIIVVVDRSVREKSPLPPPADPTLHSFRQSMGCVVLYEVSPLDHATILPRLSVPAAPGG